MAVPNGLNPNFNQISLRTSSAVILAGVATGTTAITADVGALPNGSIYISQNGNGEFWFMLGGTWTQLTIN